MDSVEEEFKNSRYIMRVEEPLDDVGYLLAVSTPMESDTEFGEFLRSLGNDLILLGGVTDLISADYSTHLKNNKWYVPCIVVTSISRVIRARVDTGACNTVFVEDSLEALSPVRTGRKRRYYSASGNVLSAYEVTVKQFKLGSIDLSECSIWVANNGTLSDNLLGADILQRVSFWNNPQTGELCFKKADASSSSAEVELRQLCEEFGLGYDKALPLLPNSWREQSRNDLCACLFVIADRIRK